MTSLDLESKRKRIQTIVAIVILCAIALPLSGIIFSIIQGLVGMVIAFIIGYAAIMFAPVIGSMIANWRLKALKAEAARNPVETLQNDFAKRQDQLAMFKDKIQQFIAQKESYENKLQDFTAKNPAEAARFKEILTKMSQLLDLRQAKYNQAKKSLSDYEKEIEKAGDIWEMGQAAAQLTKAAGMSDEDFFSKIQRETALDSVEMSMNKAFADVEVSLMDEKPDAPQVTVSEPQQISDKQSDDSISAVVAETVKVKRK